MPAETTPQSADALFRKGLEALDRKQYQQAISLLQASIGQDRQDAGGKGPSMRCLSFLGLALNLSNGRSEEGLKLCEQAARRDFFDADLFCNLGIAYMRNRQKGPAFEAFRKGLALKPKHRRILEELSRVERRESPVFPGLGRNHSVNRFLGILRHKLRLLVHRTPRLSE